MSPVLPFEPGGYAFQQGGFPYSQGVAALPGHAITRARWIRPLPVATAFAAIASHLQALGRPLTALCAMELRSPQPFTLGGFQDFNAGYVATLKDWGLYRDRLNPVARSNVCPAHNAPTEVCVQAFSYTVPTAGAAGDFVIAGSGEWPEDQAFPSGIVARGDLSASGIARKTAYVLRTMRERANALSANWAAISAVQVYTVHDFHPLLASHFAPTGLLDVGLTWQVCRPPIQELEFEMDLRSVTTEQLMMTR